MEFVLSMGVFAVAMSGMAVGVMLSNRALRGSCGGAEVIGPDGKPLSCGACPRNEREICPGDDELVRLAQIGHPNPDHHR